MTEPETLTGPEAKQALEGVVEREIVLVAEGGEAWCAEGDGSFYFVFGGWAFATPGDDEREFRGSVLRFPDRASRDEWMRLNTPMDVYRMRGWTVEPPGASNQSVFGVGGLILSAAGSWLADLAERRTECSSLKEADLQKALHERIANHSNLTKELSVQAKGDAPGAIPGWNPGGVDLVVDSDDGPVWVELKWAKSYGTLFNCLWDAAKLAGAVRSGAAVGGYLVAGAPASEWEKDHPYQDLFTFHSWEDGSIVTSFAKDWTGWLEENPKTFPSEVVDPIQILPFGFVRGGPDDWEIRVARVVSPGNLTLQLADLNTAP
jgi:hypothetical protein